MGTGANIPDEQRLDQQDIAAAGDTENHQLPVDLEQRNDRTFSVMSPFDEQEEWAKISEIMASFGTGLVRESIFVSELEKEFQTRLSFNVDTGSPIMQTLVGQWLSKLNLVDYESLFVNYGFDDLEFINGVLDETDLKDMGISSNQERSIILNAMTFLNNRVENRPAITSNQTVDDWLKSIHLENYAELFRRHLYTDMERIRRIWEVELAAVLEIQKPAHRKRILASVSGGYTLNSNSQVRNANGPNLDDLNKDLNALKTNIQQLKEEIREKLPDPAQNNTNGLSTSTTTGSTVIATVIGTNVSTIGTLKYRKNRPAPQPPQKPNTRNGVLHVSDHLEIRGPSELLFGVPSTLKTQWRHEPKDLVTGCVTYIANYLGSTVVKELRGTESTKKSIQKLKKISRDPRGTPDIILSISYRGVRFLNTVTDEPICEHEIRNIHCACQDADDLTHFAYITKDHKSRTHFCHVFCVSTMDQATEIILTLGQAFEVAYQIALKDKLGSQTVRSQSANQLMSLVSDTLNCPATTNTAEPPLRELSHNDNHSNESNIHNQNHTNLRLKPRSKSIANAFTTINLSTSSVDLSSQQPQQQSQCPDSSPNKSFTSPNSHFNSTSKNSNSNSSSKSITSDHSMMIKLLATHGRSHSVNDIKINGNQLKLTPAPVDDIGIGVKDMKAGSRAPIALSEEL